MGGAGTFGHVAGAVAPPRIHLLLPRIPAWHCLAIIEVCNSTDVAFRRDRPDCRAAECQQGYPFAARDGFKENVLRMLLQVGPQDTVEARLLRQTWPVRTSLNYFVKLLGERHASFLDQATGFESPSVPQPRL